MLGFIRAQRGRARSALFSRVLYNMDFMTFCHRSRFGEDIRSFIRVGRFWRQAQMATKWSGGRPAGPWSTSRSPQRFGSLQSNSRPFLASEVLGKCLNQKGIPKNVMIGTKNIKIGPLGPELAHSQCTVGWLQLGNKASNWNSETTFYSSTFHFTTLEPISGPKS